MHNPLPILLILLTVLKGNDTLIANERCENNYRGDPVLVSDVGHVEAALGDPLILHCRVCLPRRRDVSVSWQKEGKTVGSSEQLRGYRRERGEFVLRVQRMEANLLGNYSCTLQVEGKAIDRRLMVVSTRPPPPLWQPMPDRTSEKEQILRWAGASKQPIIDYFLEFRLKPRTGAGEDWISITVPSQEGVQEYVLRGLNPGTEYQAKVRSRTRSGLSPASPTLSFSTYSPFAPSPTKYSMSREEKMTQTFFSSSSSLSSRSFSFFLAICASLLFI